MKKALLIVRIIAAIAVVAASVLQIAGVYPRAVNLAVPLIGLVLLLQGIDIRKSNRAAAVTDFCAAAFIFIVSLVVFTMT